ncbi:hypothetical protein E1B28_010097 [Marasmius oreades]|uniref:PIN domain-like protein n=1 Tax=Marasmius oreades TaxID=181124 RepID=A0A9P7UQS7_9AGAR|nr:uncharacterized protein E1B28_010097 [Marasmius oreades]KAG7091037.1 hypothetical protein E1B28_010097 [Marasmius oreades]
MGVHGLTTYLRESKRNLSTTRSLPANDTLQFVIDGWSFIYELQLKSGLPWVYGGEYVDFVLLVTTVVQAWIDVGIRVSFVFDGPVPELKFATQISRAMKSQIEPSLLFFRTSAVSRATPRFLNECRIIPPLSYSATIRALQDLRKITDAVDLHFADEEGDPYAVELAGKLGGYVVGNDSDFVVLNSEGYLGYIPMDEMVWTSLAKDTQTPIDDLDNDGDFQQVPVSKRKKRQMQMKDPKLGRGIIPPDNTASSDLSFTFTIYSPASLASHLELPITLLPLLGALVGNDFSNNQSKKRIQELFFGRQMTLTQRIVHAAETLCTTLSGGSQARRRPKTKQQVSSVMDLIQKTVQALLSRSPSILSSGEIDAIVDGIVISTLQYAISTRDGQDGSFWPSTLCALHEPDVCPMLPIFSRHLAAVDWQEEDMEGKEFLNRIQTRKLLLEAYRSGQISPNVINCLNTGTLWPRLFLESPDVESVSHLTRPIRQWCCSIIDDAVGLPDISEEATAQDVHGEEDESDEDKSDEDELVDVVEEDSEVDEQNEDLLAPLRGALQQLHVKPDNNQAHRDSEVPSQLSPAPTLRTGRITEYVRRGIRLADETVDVPLLADLLEGCEAVDNTASTPLLLQSLNQRLAVLLHALKCPPSLAALPSDLLAPVLALRWVVHSLHEKAQKSGSKEAQNACWTRREARCFLALFSSRNLTKLRPLVATSFPEVANRHVQFTAQVLQTLEAVEQLSQVLLLTERVSTVAHQFSGRRFHEYLTCTVPSENEAVSEEHWALAIEGLEQCLGEDHQKRKKKKASANQTAAAAAPPQKSSVKTKAPSGSLYDLLRDMDT